MSNAASRLPWLAVVLGALLVLLSPLRVGAEPEADAASVARAHAEFAQGQVAYRSGQLKQALTHFLRAHELAPSAELEFDLARVYERLGEAEQAIKHFRAYLERPQLGADEHAQIEARIAGLIALRLRQRDQVIEAPPARAALTAEARAFFERGATLFRRERYQAAYAAFSAARTFVDLPELSYNLALTSERLERWDDAIAYYRAYLREAKMTADTDAIESRIRTIAAHARARDRSPRRPAP